MSSRLRLNLKVKVRIFQLVVINPVTTSGQSRARPRLRYRKVKRAGQVTCQIVREPEVTVRERVEIKLKCFINDFIL